MLNQKYRQLVILFAAAVCVSYLAYRVLFTLNLTTPYAVVVSLLLYAGEFYGVLVLGLFFLQVWDSREPPEQPVLEGRTVDVFVPTYNEDPQLLRATLEACNRLDYPHRTYVCDDGKRPAVEALAKELGIHYLIRPDNRHAKAGNLNHAFERTDGEFIIILDADHVPEPNFISRLIGYFRDEKLGFVQTPHAFYNFDSFQARLDHKNRRYWEEGHLFYEVIQPGRNRWNCPIFAGSAAMFRRRALAEVGYIAVETITEDMHTGMRVNAKGWKSLAVSKRLVAGQAAPDFTTFHSQRIRWGEGNLSIMAYDNPLTMRGLTLAQRFCYLGSMVHWAGGLFKLAIYLTPILMMFSGVPPVSEFTWELALITFLYLCTSVYGVRVASNGFGSFFNGELFCMVNFYTQIRGTLRALFWRKFQKFVVTSKRGRQAKTIWPYVRPQLVLIGLSLLALFWGWNKVGSGISDDFFKPLIPSFWILFHVLLALIVLRRALWPEDRRFSTRHIVNLPLAYKSRGIDVDGNVAGQGAKARGLGVTVDLNETGVGLVAYERLPVGGLVGLTLWGAGESVKLEGEVRWVKDLHAGDRVGPVEPGAYRYGIAFRDLRPTQMDALNRMTLHYAVPRLYSEYAQGRERTWWKRAGAWLAQGAVRRRWAWRRQARLPVVLYPDPGRTAGREGREEPLEPSVLARSLVHSLAFPPRYTVTEDVSRAALSVLLSDPLPLGTEVGFYVPTPLGEVRGRARLVREESRRYAARDYQLGVFEFLHFTDQGRVTLEMTLNPREHPQLGSVLEPDKEPMPVPVHRPAAVGLVAAVPLLLAAWAGFQVIYRNDVFLREIAVAQRRITEEEIDRVEGIFADTMAQSYPSTDRLVLLMGAMARIDRPRQVDQVTALLAPRDRRNLDLQFALAQILDNTKDYPQAEAEYQRLLGKLEDGSMPASRRRGLLLAAARASVHAGNLERAGARFHELLKAYPDQHGLRNEFAGVLMAARRFKQAAALYRGIEPDLSGRLLLVAIHAQAKDLDAAEKECRRLVQLRPDNRQAKLLLADVLSWKKGGYRQSRAVYEQLLKLNGRSPNLLLRLAQITLWNKNYNEALQRFQDLVDEHLDNPEVVKGYVDAAASADRLSEAQHRTALVLFDRTLTGPADSVFLTRLAWVLQRVNEPDKGAVLLDRAVELNPRDPALRKQWIGSLAATGRFAEHFKEFEGKELDFDTRQILVHSHLRAGNFAAAAAQCRLMARQRPGDPATQRQLADILSWDKKYPEALALFGSLVKQFPGDRELRIRQAEVTLWSGARDAALALFHALLEAKFEQPNLWPNYAAAAAGGATLAETHHRFLVRIYEATGADDTADALFLARLAWALERLKDAERARVLLDRAAVLRPQEPAARRELAGILAATGRNRDALRLFEGLTLRLTDRYQLAVLFAAEKNFAAAEKQCRAILKARPADAKAQRQLADVLSWSKKYPEALALLERLARGRPHDAELAVRLAEVTLWSGAYEKALARYQVLLEARFDRPELWPGYVDAAVGAPGLNPVQAALAVRIYDRTVTGGSKDVGFLTRLAWVLHRRRESARARLLLDRALALGPKGPAARKELAGVLAAAGRTKEALAMYLGLSLDLADRYRLAGLYAAAKDFASAEEQCRAILKVRPEDRKAQRQLADVLSWGKKYPEALALLERLARDARHDPELAVRLAEVTLWSGAAERALPLYQALLEAHFDRPDLWRGYVDASSSSPSLNREQARLAIRIYRQVTADRPPDAVLFTRLAWVLLRLREPAKTGALLDRAAALKPKGPALRKELAGVLAAAGRTKAALRMYRGVPLGPADRYHVASLYAAAGDFSAAEEQCRAILKEKPGDRKVRRLLAAALTGRKAYPEALALIQQLGEEDPADAQLPVELAQVLVWSGDYARGLARLEKLLEADFNRPALWKSFVDAAASAPELSRGQARLALRIYEHTVAGKPTDVPFLARLAWLLHRANEPGKASALLERALALRPEGTGLRRELAGTLAAVGKFPEALQMYEGMRLEAEDRYHLVGIYATALQKYLQVLEDQPDDRQARRLSTDVLSWKPTVQESVALFEKLAQAAPKDRMLQIKAAEVMLWSGAYPKALAAFQMLLEERFDQPALWRNYLDAAASAVMPLAENDRRMALRIYRRHAVLETHIEYLSRLAWVLYRVKELPRVHELLDRAVALRPKGPAVRKELAGVLAAAGRPRQARQMYAGLKLTLADRYRLAEIDLAAKRYAAAERGVEAILRARPNDRKAQLLLAAILSGSKQFGKAARLYRELARQNPDDPAVPRKLAELALWSGDYDTALAQFQKLLSKDARQPALWKGYIDAAASAAKLPESVRPTVLHIYQHTRAEIRNSQSLPASESGFGGDLTFLTRLAWVLRRVREPGKGVILLKKALTLAPHSRSIRLQLAEVLYEKGAYREADRHYKVLLKK
jgi:cellulose synthase/poly-beta-1,6-N-acetylglucosamine synthase-like glycosyltransferase/tetratricopeptide (TPR) repeat protein